MSALYDIINILPLSLLAVMLFGGYTGMPEGSIAGYAICLIFSLWIISLRSPKKKNRLRSIGIVLVFAVGLFIAAGEENRRIFAEVYFWIVYIICISAAALIAGLIADRNIWVRRTVAAAFLIYCIVGTVTDREISKEAFALICFVLLVRLAEEIQRRWKKSGCPDTKEHITRISPILLAVCLAVYIFPAPSEPYDWQFAKNIFNAAVSCAGRIYGFFSHPTDDYGSIGFSDKGGFLSGLSEKDEDVMSITAGNTTIRNFRLVGCISGDFRGREWVFDTAGESCSRMLDTIETSCAVGKYAGASQSDYLQRTDIYCENYLYNTRYIFTPAKIRLEATREKTPGASEKNGSIVSDNRLNYKDSYLASCYVLNYGNTGLAAILDNAGTISETDWKQTLKAEGAADITGYSFEDYQQYRRHIYETYCSSYSVSEDVRKILDDIRNGASGRYETAKRLEAYLKSMEYSTDCGTLPDSVQDPASYLDYFLLTSRKGYCMHFATAFTLMAGEMGIPCRYVQGYIVKRDVTGNILVKQSNAHAWPEVYFDNAGWVAFEPTPGYSVPTGWGAPDDSKDDRENENDLSDTSEGQTDPEDDSDNTATIAAEIDPLIFIVPSLAAVSFLILFCIISRFSARRKYRQMNCSDRFRYLTRQNLRYLGILGFRMESGETLAEFSDRINRSDRQEIKNTVGFIPAYETLLYSDREISEEAIKSAEKNCQDLRMLVKSRRFRFIKPNKKKSEK